MAVPIVKEFDDLAESIANPPPNRPIGRAVGEFGRQVCDSISSRPDLYAPTILQSPLRAVCQPYWDGQNYDPPVQEPPFTGGQCAGVFYRPFIEVFDPNTGAPNPNNPIQLNNIQGPVSLRTENNAPTGCGPGQTAQASQTLVGVGSTIPVRGPGCVNFNTLGAITLERIDGLPDDCGDPEGEFVPGNNPAPDPGPLPPGTGPQFDIRGNPIFVLPPQFSLEPGLDIDFSPGEINLGSGTGNGPAVEPAPGDEAAGNGSGSGGGDNDFDEPPDGERWVGCCVTITSEPIGAGSIPQAEPQSIYPRTIGNVRLRFSGADGLSEYDTPLVNRQKTTCVWEPVRGLRPVGVRVNLLPGYNYVYRPYSVPEEQ